MERIENHYVLYYANGNKEHEEYRKNGEYHRDGAPAIIYYCENGDVLCEDYYMNGKIHRDGAPALIKYHKNGNKSYEVYYNNGNHHREDGPAVTKYYENGTKEYEAYYINGKRHRNNGPAYVQYYENGTIECVTYFKHGLYHRDDGPAVIRYSEDSDEQYLEYYINGENRDAEYMKNNICDVSSDRNINDFIGRTVRHFKGSEYLVLCTAVNTESDEIMVIYKALYGENITYARPLNMFMEEVPANKENLTGQKYRFQLAYL